jgi:DNA-binding FadR family transcriptional regulator
MMSRFMRPENDPHAIDTLTAAREAVFAPVRSGGLVEQAVRRLGEAIGLGVLAAGERLPAESELAQRFVIAPSTLREALTILREAGYVTTRRGRHGGSFVASDLPRSPARPDASPERWQSAEQLRDFTDARVALSGAAAALAAELASEGDVIGLRELVAQMSGEIEFPDYRRADSRFHIAIACAAGSPRLTAAEAQFQSEVGELTRLLPQTVKVHMRIANDQHEAIVAAIAARRPELARALVEEHVASTRDVFIGLRLGDLH